MAVPKLELAGTAEAALIFKVTKQAISNYQKRDPSFPEPLARLKMGPIWNAVALREYKRVQDKLKKEK